MFICYKEKRTYIIYFLILNYILVKTNCNTILYNLYAFVLLYFIIKKIYVFKSCIYKE